MLSATGLEHGDTGQLFAPPDALVDRNDMVDQTSSSPIQSSGVVADAVATTSQPVDPVGLSYTPDKVVQATDGMLLLYSKSHQSIFRWDPATESYGTTISLIGAANDMAYSTANNTIYLAYAPNLIRKIDLNTSTPVEAPFATLPVAPLKLAIAGSYVFVATGSAHYTYKPDGTRISVMGNSSSSASSSDYTWSEANQRMYFANGGVYYQAILPDGKLGEPRGGGTDAPPRPIRVAPDGSVVVLGSGVIVDPHTSLPLTGGLTLTNSITDAAWLNGFLFTTRTVNGVTQIQRWGTSTYAPQDSVLKAGTSRFVIALADHRLLAINSAANGVPIFNIMNDNLEDLSTTGGFAVQETLGSTAVDESGTTDTIEIRLQTQPTTNVVISVTSADTGEATVSAMQLTFTPSDWNVPQVVTVKGIDDPTTDGTQLTNLKFSVVGALSDDAFDNAPDQFVAAATTDNETVVSSVIKHNGTGYFFVKNYARVDRYDIANQTWLSPIQLEGAAADEAATVGLVDGDGMYVAYGRALYRYKLDGSGRSHLLTVLDPIQTIQSDDDLLLINHTGRNYTRFISIHKSSNAIVDVGESSAEIYGTSIATSLNRIFGRPLRGAPDVTYLSYGNAGQFTGGGSIINYANYPSASKSWVFPNDSKMVDSGGTVYATSNLTYLSSLGTSINDIDFLGSNIPVVLSGKTITAYSSALRPTGSVTLAAAPSEVFVNATNVIAFTPDFNLPSGYRIDLVPLSQLQTSQPDLPIDPTGLSYTPDKIVQATDGMLLLYSKAHQSIFRWDPIAQSYGASISLIGTADYMAYSVATNTIYLAYNWGLINKIDLNVNTPAEVPFVTFPAATFVATIDPYVFVATGGKHYTYKPDGTPISVVTSGQPSWGEYVWSDANRRMYFISGYLPHDLYYLSILPDGKIGGTGDTPLHDNAGFTYPIQISPDGSAVALGSGMIHDGRSMARLTTSLADSITDAAWLNGHLFTTRTVNGVTQIQRWNASTYGPQRNVLKAGTARFLISLADGRLLAISTADNGIPIFTVLNDNLEDQTAISGFTVHETLGTTTVDESGTTDTVEVRLKAQPTTNVVISVKSADAGESTITPTQLTFTPSDWNVPQVVTVKGIDDPTVDGTQLTNLTFSVVDTLSDDAFDNAPDQIVGAATTDNETVVSSVIKHQGIGYFFVKNYARVNRYDIDNQAWLPPIQLEGATAEEASTVALVDDDGLYVAYGRAVYRYNLDGSGRTHLLTSPDQIQAIHSDGNLLLINHTAGKARFISISKSNNATLDTFEYHSAVYGSSIAPSVNRIFGTSSGSPASINYISYDNAGMFINGGQVRSIATIGSRTWAFHDDSRMIDDSGRIFATSNLTYLDSLGTSINDIDFLENTAIVLSGKTITSYSSELFPTLSTTLASAPNEIFVNANSVIAFTADPKLPTGYRVDVIPLSQLKEPQPGLPVDPIGLSYTPDQVVQAVDGMLLLYSEVHQSIFRWNPATQSYAATIPLIGPADYMAYSSATNTIYLAYNSGLIRKIELSGIVPVEVPFAKLSAAPRGLATAGPFVFAVDMPAYSSIKHYTFRPDGTRISTVDSRYSTEYIWSEANRRMYFFGEELSPNDLYYETILSDGTFGSRGDSPLHDSTDFRHPIRVAPDGSVVVLGSGMIHDAHSMARLGTRLRNGFMDGYTTIADAAWQDGYLFTINSAEIRQWSSTTYAYQSSVQITGTPRFLLALADNRLLAISTAANGVPIFSVFNSNLTSVSPPAATIAARRVFYNNSAYDGNNAAGNAADVGAIAMDKTALLPGGTASFANYTSFSKGINGIMIDVAGLRGNPNYQSFKFRVGNNGSPDSWTAAPAFSVISIRRGGGVSGTDRIAITWPDGLIKNQWLQITVLADPRTGLSNNDVFYFGNTIGDSGNSASDARVNITDQLGPRNHPTADAAITNRYDYNRDGQVNSGDELIARNQRSGMGNALGLIVLVEPMLVMPASSMASPPAILDDPIASALALSTITTLDAASQSAPVRQVEWRVEPLRAGRNSRSAAPLPFEQAVAPDGRAGALNGIAELFLQEDDWLEWRDSA